MINLYIGDSFCKDIEQLKDLFANLTEKSDRYWDLIDCGKHGDIAKWLEEHDENKIAESVMEVNIDLGDTEYINELTKIFAGTSNYFVKPSYKDCFDIQTSIKNRTSDKIDALVTFLIKNNINEIYDVILQTESETRKISFSPASYAKNSVFTQNISFKNNPNKECKFLSVYIDGKLISQKQIFTLNKFQVNDVDFEMIGVKGGTFKMGVQNTDPNSANYDPDAQPEESPVHEVTLSDFCIAKYETTQALWKAVMGNNPSVFNDDLRRPVESVSWNDIVQEFLPKLNAILKDNIRGWKFTLPTEAQWEFAARGGNNSSGFKYSGSNNINDVAWYGNQSKKGTAKEKKTYPVGQKKANELGIHDMSGNVCEWCLDSFEPYSGSSSVNPLISTQRSEKVLRSGRWNLDAKFCRVSFRDYSDPAYSNRYRGFRLALVEDK